MLGMTISRASSTFKDQGLRPMSLWLFLEKKNYVDALVPTFIDGILI